MRRPAAVLKRKMRRIWRGTWMTIRCTSHPTNSIFSSRWSVGRRWAFIPPANTDSGSRTGCSQNLLLPPRPRWGEDKSMKLGFFTMPMHPPGRDYTQTLKEDREAVILADKLGFCEAFIGEHVTDVCESIPSCLAFIASVAFETRQIKLGSGTVNLPNNHPAQVAATVAMLDHMLEGRFLFGIGPGGLRSDMEMLGNLDRDRNAMFVEAIDQILAIWAGDAPYKLTGQFWNLSTERTLLREAGQGVMVKPYHQPHPPIVVTAIVPHSKGLVAAARRGWTPITANFLQPNWAATHWPMHAQGCELGGH